jgi:hypothetical protein
MWDPLKRMKLKTFAHLTEKTKIGIGQTDIRLQEERQPLGRFLVST